jgi:AraC-like DNA-binding protein/quercetin dioxygenase-like cupin family protein
MLEMRDNTSPVVIDSDGRELVGLGTPAFPFSYGTFDPSIKDYPWHWHDEMEFVYVKEGNLVYAVGASRLVLHKGDAAFANINVPHSEQDYFRRNAQEMHIVVSPDLLCSDHEQVIWTKYLKPLFESKTLKYATLLHNGPAWQQEVITLFKQTFNAVSLELDGCEILAREYLTRACVIIERHLIHAEETSSPNVNLQTERVKTMISFINHHYSEAITVSDIAAAASVSPRECQRAFKTALGSTPVGYLSDYRLQMAASKLTSQTDSIADVSISCGFSSQSYFSKQFKKKYGQTPLEHRQLNMPL